MGALLLRIGLIAGGLGAIEIGLGDALTSASLAGWLLVGVGLLLLTAGTAGFMVPLLAERHGKGDSSR